MKNKEILLNKMYAGGYLSIGDNIGHEAINLLKADDGEYYIYVTKDGKIGANRKIKCILLVRNSGLTNTLEVIAKADDELDLNKKINLSDINYSGCNIEEIFENNSENNGQYNNDILVTFSAKSLQKPKKPLLIKFDTEENKIIDEKFNTLIQLTSKPMKRSPKMYFSKDYKEDNYKVLNDFITTKDNWIDYEEKQNLIEDIKNNNFIDLVNKQYAELTYSNLFAYIFASDEDLFKDFCDEVLEIKNAEFESVAKEEKNIDILVKCKNINIVIENKIRSGLNGIKKNKQGNNENLKTQLNKYEEYMKKEYKDKEARYFIFLPDYNYLITKEMSGDWKLITYSQIYKFYEEHIKTCEIPYFKEFVYALSKHINKTDESLEVEMKRRFENIIKSKNDSKGA